MRAFRSIAELSDAAGTELGHSDWLTIDQERIDGFAQATRDLQWIHVDPDRAADGPFGSTIAHGYLSLSLLPSLAAEVYRVEGFRMTMNYGLNRVRFPAPVPVGAKVRSSVRLDAVRESPSGTQLVLLHTLEIDGASRPGVVAEQIRLLVL